MNVTLLKLQVLEYPCCRACCRMACVKSQRSCSGRWDYCGRKYRQTRAGGTGELGPHRRPWPLPVSLSDEFLGPPPQPCPGPPDRGLQLDLGWMLPSETQFVVFPFHGTVQFL